MLSKLYIKFPKAWYFIVISFDLILACARYLFFFFFRLILSSLPSPTAARLYHYEHHMVSLACYRL